MDVRSILSAVVFAVAAAAAQSALCEIIRLPDGSFLQGEVVDSDKEGFTFKRWDTGGTVKLSWEQIVQADRTRLRTALGLEFTEQERGIMVDGFRFHLKTGDVFEGVVLEEKGENVRIRRSTGEFRYPASVIKRRETVELDILTIYTEQEAYANKLAVEGQPATADAHYEWATWCRLLGYFEKEKEHLQGVKSLAPAFKPEYIQNRLASLDALVEQAQVRRKIKDIMRMVARKKFTEAEEAWTTLKSESGDSPIVADDTESVADAISNGKIRYLAQVVVSDWYRFMGLVLRKKSLEKDLKLADAKKWLQKDLTAEIVALIVAGRGLPDAEIREAFGARKVYNARKSDYSTGTFIVEKSSKSGGGAMDGVIDDLGKRLGLDQGTRDKIKGQFGGQSGQSGQAKKAFTPDDWWDNATSDMKYQWMNAFYAENSGDMEVVRVEKRMCQTCGGKGYVTYLAAGGSQASADGGGTQATLCNRCQGIGSDRVVVFK